ncbi:YhcN/YlaJ family sporulation lipoprotein [Paenibacillus spongiae]|uniref:YhcN/YlaJ family sporulation lipoprotein n=1 Tax=Paenibacillus spongiae TaxID=2909671 RepID=A0ABY5SI02_9BACL|nr:YhcN/YlaJ family sporulation lipoprotein [Paenibacillus spongiae]UVI31873.1 YhcN/YlaJ family sporulation lipoprotein [Paenibacillus spongiae]
MTATGCATNRTTDGVKTNQYKARTTHPGTPLGTDGYRTRTTTPAPYGTTDGFRTRSTTPYGMDNTLTDGNRTRTTGPHTMMDGTGTGTHTSYHKDHSDKLAKHISSIKGVDKATVVVHNNDAIVGLDVKPGQNTSKITDEVRRTVEREHPGYKVHVTTDKNMHTRVKNFQTQMVPLDGHPIRNMSEDAGILIRDIGRTITAPFR